MTEIILMIPRKKNIVSVIADKPGPSDNGMLDELRTLAMGGELPWVQGECAREGYRGMILVDELSWSAVVEAEYAYDARLATDMPKIDHVEISRTVDISSPALTKYALTGEVFKIPWEFYFFRDVGDMGATGPRKGKDNYFEQQYMTLRLHRPRVVYYDFDSSDPDPPTETLRISAATFQWIYFRADANNRFIGVKDIKYNTQTGLLS